MSLVYLLQLYWIQEKFAMYNLHVIVHASGRIFEDHLGGFLGTILGSERRFRTSKEGSWEPFWSWRLILWK
jgi:hypothetical protein